MVPSLLTILVRPLIIPGTMVVDDDDNNEDEDAAVLVGNGKCGKDRADGGCC